MVLAIDGRHVELRSWGESRQQTRMLEGGVACLFVTQAMEAWRENLQTTGEIIDRTTSHGCETHTRIAAELWEVVCKGGILFDATSSREIQFGAESLPSATVAKIISHTSTQDKSCWTIRLTFIGLGTNWRLNGDHSNILQAIVLESIKSCLRTTLEPTKSSEWTCFTSAVDQYSSTNKSHHKHFTISIAQPLKHTK